MFSQLATNNRYHLSGLKVQFLLEKPAEPNKMGSGFKVLKVSQEVNLNHRNNHREAVGSIKRRGVSFFISGCDVMVAWNLAKVLARVRFPLSAHFYSPGAIPLSNGSRVRFSASVAQRRQHRFCKAVYKQRGFESLHWLHFKLRDRILVNSGVS